MVILSLPVRFKPLLGSILCGSLALIVSLMGHDKPGKSILPIWFLAVVMVIVFRFGSMAGVLGTILSGIIFAIYLFEPFHRLAVHDAIAKNNLMWMLLAGLALSIFGRPPDTKIASSNHKSQK
jgi:K+-sensing histidine kinase KdpD